MHIIKNLQNFLSDQTYYIDLFDKSIHIYNYKLLSNISSELIELKLENFNLTIKGKDLVIKKMDAHEILIEGQILEMRFNY